jgi:glycosyl transferase family 87
MKRNVLIGLIISVAIIIMVIAAIYVPNSLPTDSDFGAVYNAGVAFVHRVPIYDIPAVTAVAAENAGVPVEKFFLAPFPYPPWYSLSTFYLGWLPIQSAALLWFELNLAMVFFSVWFLTDGWSGRLRLIAFPLGLFFLPIIGAISIGQNVFPVLLGGAMLVYSLKKENVALTALGSVLITFKPHIGALMALAVLIYPIASRDKPALPKEHRDDVSSIEGFGRRMLRSLLIAGVILFVTGLIADPLWYVRYPKMLLGITSVNYGAGSDATLCVKCASLPVWASRWFFDGSLTTAAFIALALLIALSIVFFRVRSSLLKQPELFLNAALVITLLVSPYLFNYDFIVLLIPFAVLWSGKSGLVEKLIVILCYLAPSLAIGLYDRAGNISLLIVTIVLTTLIFLRAKSKVDVPAITAYNTNN